MNAKHALILLTYGLTFSVPNASMNAFRAPELFGDSKAVIMQSGPALHGLIFNRDYMGIISGTQDGNQVTCQITQIAGTPVIGAEKPVPCYAIRRGGHWTGWIDFRGHERKFCGAASLGRLPATCRIGK